jgi:hypothetical protein
MPLYTPPPAAPLQSGSTNLGLVVTPTTITITSDTGDDIVLPVATPTSAGVTSAAQLVAVQDLNDDAVKDFAFTQASAATVWTVAHNLGKRPTVEVFTSSGELIETPEIEHLNVNTLQIKLVLALAGSAICRA